MSWRRASAFTLALAACACATVQPEPRSSAPGPDEWVAYGRDPGGTRFSPAAQITPANAGTLQLAWRYSTGETRPEHASRRPKAFEATPLLVDGVLYFSTPLGRVIALDPTTGAERWVFDPRPPVDRNVGWSDFANRGVSTWLDTAAAAGTPCRRRIIVGTIDARLIAVDAATGAPCAGFGRDGSIDLRTGLRIVSRDVGSYQVTSPPAVVNGVIVTGSAIGDNSYLATASGEVRGYDARTGALRWTWDPIPQDSTDPAFATWRDARGGRVAAANAWSVLVADPARDLVFVPTSSASPDYYGVERLGSNVYANSIVALRASTGRVVWHFQTVHHDLWDYDNAAPPALVTLRRKGQDIPAVLQATKTGMLFVLHRETGAPLFPVEERAVPRSDVPGEQAWPTQPFSSIVLSPHSFDVDSAWGPTPQDRAVCREVMAPLRNEGIFTPPSERGTLVIPSNIGGAHWGGVAVDENRQLAIVPVNRIAALVQLLPRAPYDSGASRRDDRFDFEYNPMRGTPYWMRRRLLLGPSGLPCTPPPFGSLVAVDLRTGTKVWEVPLGEMSRDLPAALRAQHPNGLGSPHLGGPVITAGGVVFIAATLDRMIRAYDVASGRELWRGELPAGGRATPMTYVAADGRQYVVIAAGGGGAFGEGDAVLAFALPQGAGAGHQRQPREAGTQARVPD